MKKRSLKTTEIMLLLVSSFLAIGMLEAGLRLFTPFPLGASNKSPHPVLGYVLNPDFPEVDAFGFRNPAAHKRGAEIAAIGDSHTYGLRVSAAESWPGILASRTGKEVYNYGVPGYSSYQYYFLAQQAIQDGAQYILIALLLQFDGGSDLGIPCDLLRTAYYREYFEPAVKNSYRTLCAQGAQDDFDNQAAVPVRRRTFRIQALLRQTKETLKTKIAITSAVYWLLYRPRATDLHFAKKHDTLTYRVMINPQLLNEVESRMASLQATLRSIRDLCETHGVSCGILLLPSVGRVISFVQSDTFTLVNETPQELAQECALVENMQTFLRASQIPFVDTAPYLASAFQQRLARGNVFEVIVPWDSHPQRVGYMAYAEAANDLLNQLQNSRKK